MIRGYGLYGLRRLEKLERMEVLVPIISRLIDESMMGLEREEDMIAVLNANGENERG